MPIVIACNHCQRQIGVPDAAAGKAVRCPHCKGVVAVPAPLPAEAVAAPPPPPPEPPPLEDFAVLDEPAARPKPVSKRPAAGAGKKRGVFLLVGLGLACVAFAVAAPAAYFLVRGLTSYFVGGGPIAETDWQEFSPPGGKLRVLMPGNPKHETTKVGNNTLEVYNVERDRGRVAFTVLFGALSNREINAKPWHERFQAAGQGMVKAVPGAKIRSQKHLRLDGNSGMEFIIDTPGKGTAVAHIYGVHSTDRNQYLTLVAEGPDYGPDAPVVKKFFDSLRLEKEPPDVLAGRLAAASRAQKLELIADLKKHGAAASPAVPALAEVVKDTQFVEGCTAAAELLGDLGPAAAAATPALSAVLEAQQPRKDSRGNIFIRLAVAGALARIDAKNAVARAALRDITKDGNVELVITARAYLVKVDPVANAADLDEMIRVWQKSSAGTFINVTKELKDLGPLAAKAIPVLVDALRVKDEQRQIYAIQILAAIGPTAAAALPALRALDVDGAPPDLRRESRDACKAIESAP